MAHVEKRADRSYRARYRAPDGRERSRTFATKRDAEAWLTTTEHAKLSQEWVDPALGKQRFAGYADAWLATKADVAASTLQNVQGRLRKHATPYFGAMAIANVRPTHARAYVALLVARGLAPSTVKGIVLTTAQVFAAAVEDRMIARNPFMSVPLPRARHTEEMRFLDAGQVNVLAAAMTDARYRAGIYLAAYGGLRAGELWALHVDRVNVLARTVDIVESMSEAGGLHVGPTKTGKRRTVTVPRFMAQMLGEHIGRYPSPDGFVFTAAEGGPVGHRNFKRRHYGPAVARADVPEGLRFHDLRHTCAALLVANGQHLEEVKDYLGHSSIRVTSDRYGHLFPKARAKLADALESTYREAQAAAPAAWPRPETEIVSIADAQQRPQNGR